VEFSNNIVVESRSSYERNAVMNTQDREVKRKAVNSEQNIHDDEINKIPTMGEIGLNQFVPYLMNRIMGRWNSNLHERIVKNNLSTVKMRILAVLTVHSGLTINQLSVYTVIEQSTISRSLDRMQDQGLIRRETGQEDGRIREIHIMDKGRAAFNEFWPEMYKTYQNLFAGVDESEREEFIKTLHKLLDNIRENSI
jgi:MarR family transcriptional regulator for hemolysin